METLGKRTSVSLVFRKVFIDKKTSNLEGVRTFHSVEGTKMPRPD